MIAFTIPKGWKEGAGEVAVAESAQASKTETQDDEDIWDDESSSTKKSSGGGGGLGNAVSTMASGDAPEEEEESLHSLAREGNAEGLKAFIHGHAGIDVNAKDEYVCTHPVGTM